jgi:DNA-binding NarL/FixJ family response regulator
VVGAEQISESPALRVVLVDARDERRQVMRHVVEGTEAGATVVGQADSSATAIDVVGQQEADVVVLEIQMPLGQGLETVVALRKSFPNVGIVVCSFHLDPATKQQALAQGADAYLAKPIGPRDLNAVLRTLGTPRLQSREVCRSE